MRAILSWKIDTGIYAYIVPIGNTGSHIYGPIGEDTGQWREIVNTASAWDESKYHDHFEYMAAEVRNKYGIKMTYENDGLFEEEASDMVLLSVDDISDSGNPLVTKEALDRTLRKFRDEVCGMTMSITSRLESNVAKSLKEFSADTHNKIVHRTELLKSAVTSATRELSGFTVNLSAVTAGLEDKNREFGGTIYEYTGKVENVMTAVTGMGTRISGFTEKIENNFVKFSGTVMTAVDGISSGFTSLKKGYEAIELDFGKLGGQYQVLSGHVAAFSGSVAQLRPVIDSVGGSLTVLSGKVGTMSGALAQAETDVRSLSGSVNSAFSMYEAIDTELGRVVGTYSAALETVRLNLDTLSSMTADYDRVVSAGGTAGNIFTAVTTMQTTIGIMSDTIASLQSSIGNIDTSMMNSAQNSISSLSAMTTEMGDMYEWYKQSGQTINDFITNPSTGLNPNPPIVDETGITTASAVRAAAMNSSSAGTFEYVSPNGRYGLRIGDDGIMFMGGGEWISVPDDFFQGK